MSIGFLLAIPTAVATVMVGLYAIYRWGPGVVRRSVHCPEKKVKARIEVLRREGSFCTLLDADVTSCSLLPAGTVDCDKACLG